MNILFLDIDGVLNNSLDQVRSSDQLITEGWLWLNKFNLSNIVDLVKTLDLKIVISSDWRRKHQALSFIRSELLYNGIEIFGTTKMTGDHRSFEIKDWLDSNKFNFAIIVDDLPSEMVDPNIDRVLFFNTDFTLGFTEENKDFIVERINNLDWL